MIVSDSGVLIWLARYRLLGLLQKFFDKIIIPSSIYKEVVVIGIRKGYNDAYEVKNKIDDFIFVKKGKYDKKTIKKTEKSLGIALGKAEEDCICLAKELKTMFLTNDEEASIISNKIGIKTKGVLYILLRAVKERIMKKDEVLKIFEKMIEDGFWINPQTVLEFMELIEKM
jgi:predicted nucleic acid-binding protein